jgi:hypothetical protein
MAEVPKDLREVKQAVETELLDKPGVVGVDIGYKQVRGRDTGILAIRVFVEQKGDVPEKDRVPLRIGDYESAPRRRGCSSPRRGRWFLSWWRRDKRHGRFPYARVSSLNSLP